MSIRYFTVEEANRTIPLVRRIVEDIVQDYRQWKELVRKYEILSGVNEGEETGEQINMRAEIERFAALIDGYMEELSAVGCVFKGFEDGLVDFHGRIDDRDVFWCWKLGETSIDHWHEIEAGFAGRRPLIEAPVPGGEE